MIQSNLTYFFLGRVYMCVFMVSGYVFLILHVRVCRRVQLYDCICCAEQHASMTSFLFLLYSGCDITLGSDPPEAFPSLRDGARVNDPHFIALWDSTEASLTAYFADVA